MTSMCDGWSESLENLTAHRFLHIHRNGRRGWCCPREGVCRSLTWTLDYFAERGWPTPEQAAAVLSRGVHPWTPGGVR